MTNIKRERRVFTVLSAIAIILVVYVTVRLLANDTAFSIVPGWHTVIYPADITWGILTALIIVIGLVAYLIFRGIFVMLTVGWRRLKKLR